MAKANTKTLTTRPALFETSEDLKTALLIVSVTINLFLFTAWLVVQTDPRYAALFLLG